MTADLLLVESDSGPVAGAYVAAIEDVLAGGDLVQESQDPTSVATNFGAGRAATRELLGASLDIRSEKLALPVAPARKPDPIFAVANLLWILSGSDRAESITHYNPRGHDFSEEDGRLAGALGPRLFGNGAFSAAIRRLKKDSSSRRAVIPVFGHEHMIDARDIPCTVAIQYMIRHGLVDCIVTVRSQSALMMLPYDLFQFQALHRLTGSALGLPIGRYLHQCGSLHIYENEIPAARAVVSAGAVEAQFSDPTWDWAAITELLTWETDIRQSVRAGATDEVHRLARWVEPSNFWAEARNILSLHALNAIGSSVASAHLQRLAPDVASTVSLRQGS